MLLLKVVNKFVIAGDKKTSKNRSKFIVSEDLEYEMSEYT